MSFSNNGDRKGEAAKERRGAEPNSQTNVTHRKYVGGKSRVHSRYGGYENQPIVQLKANNNAELDGPDAHEQAKKGTEGSGSQLPFVDTIQSAFGPHDISKVSAHTGGPAKEASEALGAEAFAAGGKVAFASSPSLHTAAHEAAHVVQQQSGVQLAGGVGREGDRYEQHADRVADLVVAGKSAVDVLNEMVDPLASGSLASEKSDAVQHKRHRGKKEGRKRKRTTCRMINLQLKKGEVHVELDVGTAHGSSPGTTGETSYCTIKVYKCNELTSWAKSDGGVDSTKADIHVTHLKTAKQSKGKTKKKKRTTCRMINLQLKKGEVHVELDAGAAHGIRPGTTGQTSYCTIEVYDCSELTSWAKSDGSLDDTKADIHVTQLKAHRESRRNKRLRKKARVVRATPMTQNSKGTTFQIQVKPDWVFNTYWKVELLNDDGSTRSRGIVEGSYDSFDRTATLLFPAGSPYGYSQVRLIPYN